MPHGTGVANIAPPGACRRDLDQGLAQSARKSAGAVLHHGADGRPAVMLMKPEPAYTACQQPLGR